jgi:protochlorophyllide reductase
VFPLFMKYVTGGYVSEAEAGERLAQTVSDPKCTKSGVYWSWNGGAKTVGYFDVSKKQVVGAGGAGGEIFENEPSEQVRDPATATKLFELCDAAVAEYLKPAETPAKEALPA